MNLVIIDPMSLQPNDMDTVLRNKLVELWFSENNLEDYKMFLLYWTEPGKSWKQRWQYERLSSLEDVSSLGYANAQRFNPPKT